MLPSLTHKMGMEIIGLQAINHAGHFADTPVLEFQYRDTGRIIFVLLENPVLDLVE